MLWLILCENDLDWFSVSSAPILKFIDYRKDGLRVIQEAGQKARPETDWAKIVLLGNGQVIERLQGG